MITIIIIVQVFRMSNSFKPVTLSLIAFVKYISILYKLHVHFVLEDTDIAFCISLGISCLYVIHNYCLFHYINFLNHIIMLALIPVIFQCLYYVYHL